MSKILDESVSSPYPLSENKGSAWDFQCPVSQGCGEPGGAGFSSKGWPTKAAALARGQQHFDEHKGLGVAPSLDEFRKEQGLAVDGEGAVVRVEDL